MNLFIDLNSPEGRRAVAAAQRLVAVSLPPRDTGDPGHPDRDLVFTTEMAHVNGDPQAQAALTVALAHVAGAVVAILAFETGVGTAEAWERVDALLDGLPPSGFLRLV